MKWKAVGFINLFILAASQCKLWIDWLQNADFNDAGETITLTGSPGLAPTPEPLPYLPLLFQD